MRHTGPLATEAEIASILKSIWGDKAEIEVSLTANADFVFTAKITFKAKCRKSFLTKYKMNQMIELTLQYVPDCKICYGHDHMLLKCPFKSIRPIWNISLGEPGNTRRQARISSNTMGTTD